MGRPVELGGPIGFCYIDGNHTYEFVRRDFHNTDRFMEDGGFLLVDDSADSSWNIHRDVNRVAREIASTGRYEIIEKNPNYLFKKAAAVRESSERSNP